MYHPSLEEVKGLAKQGSLVPIYRDIMADLETPVSAYLKIARGEYSFLLESVEGGERLARYSFVGTEPYLVLQGKGKAEGAGDPLIAVEKELKKHRLVRLPGMPRFHGGAVGYLGWEAIQHYENIPSQELDPLGLPESVFMFADTLLVFDHLMHKIRVVSHAHLDGDVERAYMGAVEKIERLVHRLERPLKAELLGANGPEPQEPPQLTPSVSREEFEAQVRRIRQYIIDGDCIQVVLSFRLARPIHVHPFAIYRALRTINPSPYMYHLHLGGDFYIVGTSPELLVRVEDGHIDYRPLAGTVRRGRTPEEDEALERELLSDEKERAEHIMLVDLGRNDVGRVSQPGSVRVTELMGVERYSHVIHIVSHVQGQLREDCTPFDALRSCFPAGTVSGAPKIRAMEILAELEPMKRGPYAGTVGYLGYSGNLDSAIAIRTLVVNNGVAYAQAGGGIVYDSVPEKEYQECMNKMRALLRAIDVAEGRG